MDQTFTSTQKYLIIGPRKVREVVALVKEMSPVTALEKLVFVRKRSSELLAKVIKTAMAQARVKGVSDSDLVFKEIQITEGPRLKRGRPVSRGRWHPYKKRMSHIRVTLSVNKKKVEKSEVKKVETEKVEEVKKGKAKK